jgi:NAD(P)-dependent dehydrogenase (short-subunit alcohol dehydrogenase family)
MLGAAVSWSWARIGVISSFSISMVKASCWKKRQRLGHFQTARCARSYRRWRRRSQGQNGHRTRSNDHQYCLEFDVRGASRAVRYAVAKTALVGLTRELGRGLHHRSVSMALPASSIRRHRAAGARDHTAPARGQPKEYAAVIGFLVFDARYITGQVIPVDGVENLRDRDPKTPVQGSSTKKGLPRAGCRTPD